MIAPQNQICIYYQSVNGQIYAYASDGTSDGRVLVGDEAKAALEKLANDFGLDPDDLLDRNNNSRLMTQMGVPSE